MVETVYSISGSPHLALLTDLHNRPYAPVIDSLRHHRPDLICIAGDVLYGTYPGNTSPLVTQTNVLPFFHDCSSIAPTFFSLGNHEWMLNEEDISRIEQTGTVVLDNSWIAQNGIVIGGLTSGHVPNHIIMRDSSGRYLPKKNLNPSYMPDTSWLSFFTNVPGFHVLLSHHPEYYTLIPSGIQLILSGHAHGGQWRFFGHGVFAPGQGFWPKWSKGVYQNRMIISTGLSNTAWVPRFFNPPEIVYVR